MTIPVTCECGQHFETSEANAGCRARCPDCGRELMVPVLAAKPEVVFLPEEPGSTATSGKAIASLALGILFFFAFLTGLPAILIGREALQDIHGSGGRLRGRRMAIAGIVLGVLGCLFTIALVLPAFRSAGEAARRSQCVNNLKQIGLAFHNYHDLYGCLPPAAITDKNGKPLLSWRVAILPLLEASPISSKFHLDEPWDSPHNLTLLDAMPDVFACPSDFSLKAGMTGYQVVVGPRTAFRPDFEPVTFADITDGTSLTILVAESRRPVPWTKPDDVPFDLSVPLSGLGSHHGYHNNGLNVLIADGSVRFIKSSISTSVLGAFLTRDGGEAISADSY